MKPFAKNIISDYTGVLGNTGFYKRFVDGVEIVQRCPRSKKKPHDNRTWSPQVWKFHRAIQWVKLILAEPGMKELYSKEAHGFTNANSIAMKDFLVPPVIGKVVTTGYSGRVGYRIRIHCVNVVPVKSVIVTIEGEGNSIIESGNAVILKSGSDWQYVTTRPNPDFKGSLLRILVTDIPDNKVEYTRTL